ncbi:Os09g0536100 [Oryza sativa Japonica Group]|uniref:Os09g0536100 protein n=1 Tax=Oryza sativa subsp. japonica TaxID=39947 RepID=A0A0P0XR02_ORYSJ|nr:hypothetical protein EE612_049171 [Oryza sativa]BAT09151.1 Os09g0536100 [Oryza sativa Japonica Group]
MEAGTRNENVINSRTIIVYFSSNFLIKTASPFSSSSGSLAAATKELGGGDGEGARRRRNLGLGFRWGFRRLGWRWRALPRLDSLATATGGTGAFSCSSLSPARRRPRARGPQWQVAAARNAVVDAQATEQATTVPHPVQALLVARAAIGICESGFSPGTGHGPRRW